MWGAEQIRPKLPDYSQVIMVMKPNNNDNQKNKDVISGSPTRLEKNQNPIKHFPSINIT